MHLTKQKDCYSKTQRVYPLRESNNNLYMFHFCCVNIIVYILECKLCILHFGCVKCVCYISQIKFCLALSFPLRALRYEAHSLCHRKRPCQRELLLLLVETCEHHLKWLPYRFARNATASAHLCELVQNRLWHLVFFKIHM